MYKRFIRWASDRLADDGIIAFVSNSAFLDSKQDDGFRKVIADEFNELWVINLKGNARTSGERRRQEGGNVFDDKIRVGVAVYFLVRRKGVSGFKVFYNAVDDYAKSHDKAEYIRGKMMQDFNFDELAPDEFGQWLNQSANRYRFRQLMPLANRETKLAKTAGDEQAVFKLSALGVNTARDEWVYDFAVRGLRDKALFFSDKYNELLDKKDYSYDTAIKWSRDLRNEFQRGRRITYNDANRLETLYRPFVKKHHFADYVMNDVLTRNHYEMFGADLRQSNRVINFCVNGRYFYTLASDKLTDWHFTGDTQCLPLYRYTPDGQRVSNITDWAVREFNEHCREVLGDYCQEFFGDDGITAEDIFSYVYAVLHDPVYRHDYEADLLREFPRLPFYKDFPDWVRMGRELLDLHLGFETIEPYPLEWVEQSGPPSKAVLRADKEKGAIVLDAKTTLTGIPESAWRYRLGSRSALEWVLDQYKERKPRDPTIAAKFNAYRFADYKENVIDLLCRVCAVSVKTMDVINDMACLLENGEIGVYGYRDESEWSASSSRSPRRQWLYGPASGKRDGAWSET